MKTTILFLKIYLMLTVALYGCRNSADVQPEKVFVKGGEPVEIIQNGKLWIPGGGSLTGNGINNYLIAGMSVTEGDFTVRMRLSLDSFNFSGASFMIGGNHFGFDGRSVDGKSVLFVEGPVLGKTLLIAGTEGKIKSGEPFSAEVSVRGTNLSFQINGEKVYSTSMNGLLKGSLALRPWKNTMHVTDFSATGNLVAVEKLVWLFESGTSGYNTFRIPAIITTTKGTLLAFAEGRKNSSSDTGDIDLVLKRSEDSGKTWSDLSVIWNNGENVCGNPAPVVDKTTGTIFLLSTWNLGTDHESEIIKQTSKDTRRVYLLFSTDDGKSWSEPAEITNSVKLPDWTWYATGPCHGIQTEIGSSKGRLIIPCDHIESVTNKYYSHIIYSDDHGKIWKLGGTTPQDQVNECSVAELSDGRLMLNMRNYDRTQKSRKISLSDDGGLTWGNIYSDNTLIEPICQGSLLAHSSTAEGATWLIFSNPADENERINITLRLSKDEGRTWSGSKVLHPGPSAYSDLVRMPDGDVGCLYEAGYVWRYQGIVFRKISLSDFRN